MNNELELVKINAGNLRDHHFEAIHDLLSSGNANLACVSILRRIADMSGSTSSFITISLFNEAGNDSNVFTSASTGPFFPVVQNKPDVVETLANFGWVNLHQNYSQKLPNVEAFTNQTFYGYPLFDQLGRLSGSFAVIVSSPVSIQTIEEECSMLLGLLVHRVQEFQLLKRTLPQTPLNEVLQIAKRGVIFPSLSDMYSQSAHTINGQLAVASLQSQILTNPDITDETLNLGLTRISSAIAQTGLLLHRQENAFTLLTDQSKVSDLSYSVQMAKTSFDILMTNKVPSVLHMDVSKHTMIDVPGNVAYWMFHNVLRMVGSIYQWIPGPEKAIEIYATTVTESLSSQTYTEIRVHVPFNSAILEISQTLFNLNASYFSGEPLANLGAILFGIMSMVNFKWGVESTEKEIIIRAEIPNAPSNE